MLLAYGIGEVCPAFLILSGRLYYDGWYKIPGLSDKTNIGISDSGYLNNLNSLEWIKHFAAYTAKMSKCQYRLLILNGYGSYYILNLLNMPIIITLFSSVCYIFRYYSIISKMSSDHMASSA